MDTTKIQKKPAGEWDYISQTDTWISKMSALLNGPEEYRYTTPDGVEITQDNCYPVNHPETDSLTHYVVEDSNKHIHAIILAD